MSIESHSQVDVCTNKPREVEVTPRTICTFYSSPDWRVFSDTGLPKRGRNLRQEIGHWSEEPDRRSVKSIVLF